ncbi:MAG TPA: shikimate dehydrogenase [Burkholderiaceae bacterium]|nr:shikimate dehydrogenase [Burkholderiaceae bacterium]
MTDSYAVIGNPISHTKSPLIHTLFAQATGQDMTYTALLGNPGAFAQDVAAFRQTGGRGMNVTVPFKIDAFACATDPSERARMAGAVNALKFDGDRILAENFDGIGLTRDVTHNLSTPMRGRKVLILGAGGATRGMVMPFLAEQPAELVIANRTAATAQALVAEVLALAPGSPVRACGYADLTDAYDLVFNATSASLHAATPPVPAVAFGSGCLAYDLTYGKGLTPFLVLARDAGVTQLADGVGMLVEQAAEAFEWWRGVRPDTRDVIRQLTVPLD